ncbi:venom serine protease-like [Zerene cesonia]|uniref:venom serine protease-like n=1 Tax=Zerene cesonia TaxID=33412 RepID=UPI0018E523A1|nr:venom serine protease-like [Zerene cesonia]
MMYLVITTLVSLASYVNAQSANCDFDQEIAVGQTYYIYNPNYPNSYAPSTVCRWMLRCPPGYNCRLDCDLNMPSTYMCSGDHILVSRSGDPQLVAAERYCGDGVLNVVSMGQTMSVGLETTYYTSGGNFLCEVTAQEPVTTTTCKCGVKKTTRIVGGEDAKPNEYPMMVAVIEQGSSTVMCGGVIISETYVLTAAHCVERKNYRNIGVVVGEHDLSTGTETPYTKGYRVSRIAIHPYYSNVTYDYDASILTTAQQIVFSDYVGTVCLPFRYSQYDFTGEKLTALGWGTLYIGGPTPDVLQKVVLDVISQDACSRRVNSLTPRQLCTYTPGKDACQMDSGGPLLFTASNGLLYNAGIVSSGSLCASAGRPGINTRVTEILRWILYIAPANYCVK